MAKDKICTVCGWSGREKMASPGGCLVEITLWLLLLIPGIIYTVWRMTHKFPVCPNCGAERSMVPLNSPAAKQLLNNE